MKPNLIVVSEPKEMFESKANDLLAEGWVVHGSPSFSSESGKEMITQVFIKPNTTLEQDREETKTLLGESGGDA